MNRIPVQQPSPFGPKLFLSSGLMLATAAYALWQLFAGQPTVAITTPAAAAAQVAPAAPSAGATPPPNAEEAQDNGSDESSEQAPAPKPAPAPAPIPASKPKGLYVDGTYAGSVANAYYGNVQVEAIVQNGKLADVKFLQYPSDRSTSRYINSQAMPLLTQEAIQAQSAQVDGVSGASDTSQAFVESLASALASAKS